MTRRAVNLDGRRAEELMLRAVAAGATTRPHPNPRVGAVVVSPRGEVVSVRAHEGPGLPHAEALALREAGAAARDGTLVVTLEPCDHHGRTPPCTEAILAAGIRRVIVGVEDPDPRVAGRGVARLREAGVEVEVGVGAEAAVALDPGYLHHRRTGRPRVVLKLATTLDGQVAARDGTSRWITSSDAREDAHRLRADVDAVMVGAGTVISDDPRLDVRLPGHDGPQPRPIVVAGTRPLPATAVVLDRKPLVYAPGELHLPGAEVVVTGDGSRVDLDRALRDLGDRGICDLLVEGGPTLARSLLDAGRVDRLVVYLSGRLAGGTGRPAFAGVWGTLSDARPLELVQVRRIGSDLRIDAEVA